MADNARLLYHLSQAESTVWQQGGPAALAFQHQLAELYRQGSLGYAAAMEVLHPDGILAAQYMAHPSQEWQPQVSASPAFPMVATVQDVAQLQESSGAHASVVPPVRDQGRAEGTLIETSTVTAYQMSANESAAWSRGDHEARMVEANIGDALKDVTKSQPVAVLLDDGRAMWTQGESLLETFTASIGLLRDRLTALASGVQVYADLSVQFGRPQQATQARADRQQHQGMGL